jgi:hypothetical protein
MLRRLSMKAVLIYLLKKQVYSLNSSRISNAALAITVPGP